MDDIRRKVLGTVALAVTLLFAASGPFGGSAWASHTCGVNFVRTGSEHSAYYMLCNFAISSFDVTTNQPGWATGPAGAAPNSFAEPSFICGGDGPSYRFGCNHDSRSGYGPPTWVEGQYRSNGVDPCGSLGFGRQRFDFAVREGSTTVWSGYKEVTNCTTTTPPVVDPGSDETEPYCYTHRHIRGHRHRPLHRHRSGRLHRHYRLHRHVQRHRHCV